MTWAYTLAVFIIGIATGAIAMRFGSLKLRKQYTLQYKLDKSKIELERYRQELVDHFTYSAELLDNMAQNYNLLYQHIAKKSNNLLLELPNQKNLFQYKFTKKKASNYEEKIESPRDYSDNTPDLLHDEIQPHNK
ncbi:hypothetical protein SCc_586 [Serratia symbiotica str. 'Cinara cedri']|nr:hypothetical protein SCc_586 [Serratia symbiotica str. 'Cinara cedri']